VTRPLVAFSVLETGMIAFERPRYNSAQEATSEDPGLRRELRSRLSAPNRWADEASRVAQLLIA
jgi:hypothetical protein